MTRRDRHTMLMDIAVIVSRRSTCQRAQVGAVIARDGRVLSMGYNGAPPGMPHCEHDLSWGPQPACTNAIHAELNAIAWAARAGMRTDGASLYTTYQPCHSCGQAIVSAGITKVYYFCSYHSAFKFPPGIFVAHQLPSEQAVR